MEKNMVTLSKRNTIRFIKTPLVTFYFFSLVLMALSANAEDKASTANEPKSIKVDITDIQNPTDVLAEVQRAQRVQQHAPDTTIVVSSDDPDILKGIAERPHQNIVLAPYADVAKPETQNRFVSILRTIKDQTITAVKSDKIGCLVVTFNLASETLIWIHSGNLTTFQKSSNITLSLLMALYFGLNKDRWAKTTAPIKDFLSKATGLAKKDMPRHDLRNLAIRFFSSFALGSAISAARIPFLPMDSLVDFTLNLNSWTMPFLISFVSSAASLGWSEHIVLINEKKQPITKFLFRRLSELKSITLGTFAATAMLFNPVEYGPNPWIWLGATGALGLTFYLNADKVSHVENNPFLKRVFKFHTLQCLNFYQSN